MHVRRASCSRAHARCHAESLSPLESLNCPVQRSLGVHQFVARRGPWHAGARGGHLNDHFHQEYEGKSLGLVHTDAEQEVTKQRSLH